MNFLKLYIGDYLRDTGTLTVAEHGAYMLMLLHVYATERPLPQGRELHRLLRAETKADRDAIDSVASRFWYVTPGGLLNKRADLEMVKANHQREVNRSIGKLGGRPKRIETESVIESGAESEPNRNPNHSQIPDKETPIPPRGRKTAAVGLSAWLEATKAAGEKPIPEGDPVFTYAAEVSIPPEFLRLAWLEFRHQYTQAGAKRYSDWRRHFRNAVRKNWLKLWWLDPASNQYGLTTVGLQAQRAHAERRQA